MSENNLNLPKTVFSMKANLPSKEPKILENWDKTKLYEKLRKRSSGKEKFILHDGPPYANGHIHMGTALNKILKDIVTKFHQMNNNPFFCKLSTFLSKILSWNFIFIFFLFFIFLLNFPLYW